MAKRQPFQGESVPFPPLQLAAWRKHRGLPQRKLAPLVGLSASRISQIEQGKQPWNPRLLERSAAALGCQPLDLLRRPTKDDRGPRTPSPAPLRVDGSDDDDERCQFPGGLSPRLRRYLEHRLRELNAQLPEPPRRRRLAWSALTPPVRVLETSPETPEARRRRQQRRYAAIRRKHLIPTDEVAVALGITRAQLYRVERGKELASDDLSSAMAQFYRRWIVGLDEL